MILLVVCESLDRKEDTHGVSRPQHPPKSYTAIVRFVAAAGWLCCPITQSINRSWIHEMLLGSCLRYKSYLESVMMVLPLRSCINRPYAYHVTYARGIYLSQIKTGT